MTEDEARTKWCPHVRYIAKFNGPCVGTYNRGYEDTGINKSLCIASDCMMFRWHSGFASGYCGLAGDEPRVKKDGKETE